jgi:hypothetical protein
MFAGCGGTYQKYQETLTLAFDKPSDAYLSLEAVRLAPNDLLSVKNGESAIAIVGLAFIENDQTKWISNDEVLLNFQHGRLIKTSGLPIDLLYVSDLDKDQLAHKVDIKTGDEWRSQYDLSSGQYGYHIHSRFSEFYTDKLTLWDKEFTLSCITESVAFDRNLSTLAFQQSVTNLFCFDGTTGTLVKSVQKLPFANTSFEFIYLSRLARMGDS